MNKRGLFWYIFPPFLAIILAAMASVAIYGSLAMRELYLDTVREELETKARFLIPQAGGLVAAGDYDRLQQLAVELGKRGKTRVTVILKSGAVVADSQEQPLVMDNHRTRPEVAEALKGLVASSERYSTTLGERLMYLAVPLRRNKQVEGVLRTAISISQVDRALSRMRDRMAMALVFVALAAALLGILVTNRITLPLRVMQSFIKRYAEGDLDQRMEVSGSREIQDLALAMNRTAEELSQHMQILEEQRNLTEAILSSMKEGVMAVGPDERVIRVNQAAASMVENTPEKIQGALVSGLIRSTRFHGFINEALSSGRVMETDIALARETKRILYVHSVPLHDVGGSLLGVLLVFQDVTRLRNLENMRRDFVSNVSHEIKTPLTAIKGFAETLQDEAGSGPEEAGRFMEIIIRHVDRLNALVEDLLMLSRVEHEDEKNKLRMEACQVDAVLRSAVNLCLEAARQKEIKIELAVHEKITATLDYGLMEHAVANLVDNAVKYSEKGAEIQVKARLENQELVLTCTDQGMGIPREDLPRVFERFFRVDKSRSRKMGGTGLGLAIVKHIAAAHGGRVEAQSTLGKGSTFTIRIPIKD